MLKISCVALAALLVLGGCKEEPVAAPQATALQKAVFAAPAFEVRTNSPDATVKTWWRLADADEGEALDRCNALRTHPLAVVRDSIVTGAIAKHWVELTCDPSRNEREIRKVSIESETRAIVEVVIRDTTPPKPGVVLDSALAGRIAAGNAYRYLLERTDAAGPWQMSQIYSDWSRVDPTNPWRPMYD